MKKTFLLSLIISLSLSLQGCFAFLAGTAVAAAASVATTVAVTAVRVPIIVGEKAIDMAMGDDEDEVEEIKNPDKEEDTI